MRKSDGDKQGNSSYQTIPLSESPIKISALTSL